MNTKSQKALIWTALILGTVYGIAFVFLVGFFPPPPATLNAEQVVNLYTQNHLRVQIGIAVMILTGAFFLPWAVVVSHQMARYEKGLPIWAFLQGLASAIGTWIFVIPVIFWGIAAFSVDRDPALTLLMHHTGWLFFLTPVSFFPFQLVPVAVICFSDAAAEDRYSAFPRWIGFFTLWTSIAAIGGLLSLIFKTGPFAWNGVIAFYLALIIFAAWMGALSYTLLRAIKHQERIGTA